MVNFKRVRAGGKIERLNEEFAGALAKRPLQQAADRLARRRLRYPQRSLSTLHRSGTFCVCLQRGPSRYWDEAPGV